MTPVEAVRPTVCGITAFLNGEERIIEAD